MTISDIARSLPRETANAAFANLQPDAVHTLPVRHTKNQHLLSDVPLDAGTQFHRTLRLLCDFDQQPTPNERAYLGWISALRRAVLSLGIEELSVESDLEACGGVCHGTCDLLVQGGPAPIGVIEAKVIVSGTQEIPRGRDLVQLGSYARLVAANRSFDEVWAGLAYVELETRLVRLLVFNSSRPLVSRTLNILRAA
jgi:hypothetical protein